MGRAGFPQAVDGIFGGIVTAYFAVAEQGAPATTVSHDTEQDFSGGVDILREHGTTPS